MEKLMNTEQAEQNEAMENLLETYHEAVASGTLEGWFTMRELVDFLNYCKKQYFAEVPAPVMTDGEYDVLFEYLKKVEKETGVTLPDSPTVNAGYKTKTKLREVKHSHPMLSLDKTKSYAGVISLLGTHKAVAMLKMDGLTCSLCYEDGNLVGAETRGDGIIGEDILHNAKVIGSIPKTIPASDRTVIDGEIICDFDSFNRIAVPNGYKNARNYAAGSARLEDAAECAKRGLSFVSWDAIEGGGEYLSDSLGMLPELGFTVVPFVKFRLGTDHPERQLMEVVETLLKSAEDRKYPYDGIVFKIDSVEEFGKMGRTGEFFKGGIAYKFEDEKYETYVRDIRYTMGKTDVLTPTAIFDPVEIDGTTVSKASVHNISVMEELHLAPGDRITVYKANMIIPQVAENLSIGSRGAENEFVPPSVCPICGHPAKIRKTGSAKSLYCTNPVCGGKLLGRCGHFVSREAMDIMGLSENTLAKFIDAGFINDFSDIYRLGEHRDEIATMDGFGEKSADNIIASVEKSRDTTLNRFLYALCIPLIGRKASRLISKECGNDYDTFEKMCDDGFRWSDIADFGELMEQSLYDFFNGNRERMRSLADMMRFEKPEEAAVSGGTLIEGKTFVVTGKVYHFKNRDELKAKIEALGGKVTGSVTKNTDYLINNDVNSTSGKNKKAAELGVPVISEDEFMKMV